MSPFPPREGGKGGVVVRFADADADANADPPFCRCFCSAFAGYRDFAADRRFSLIVLYLSHSESSRGFTNFEPKSPRSRLKIGSISSQDRLEIASRSRRSRVDLKLIKHCGYFERKSRTLRGSTFAARAALSAGAGNHPPLSHAAASKVMYTPLW